MDAAPWPTRTYLRRVLRWWAGTGPAAGPQIYRCRLRPTSGEPGCFADRSNSGQHRIASIAASHRLTHCSGILCACSSPSAA
ncbi:hypothetical protein EYR27_15135 [Xanthomonas oryzae]|nr:hypothetical protein EYR27_15135 [Xanthomonas oryzae]